MPATDVEDRGRSAPRRQGVCRGGGSDGKVFWVDDDEPNGWVAFPGKGPGSRWGGSDVYRGTGREDAAGRLVYVFDPEGAREAAAGKLGLGEGRSRAAHAAVGLLGARTLLRWRPGTRPDAADPSPRPPRAWPAGP